MKNAIIIVLLLGLVVTAYLLATRLRPVKRDTHVADSLARQLIVAHAATDSAVARAHRDSVAYAGKLAAAETVTRRAVQTRNKAVETLRQFMAQNPDPQRDSLTKAVLASADSVERSLRAENAVLRDRVAEGADAYEALTADMKTTRETTALLIAEKDKVIDQLTTDYEETVKANRRLKVVAIGGTVLGVVGILLAL
jgi:hypothetical protein